MKKYSDMICGFIGIFVALLMLLLSLEIVRKEGDLIGAAFVPQIVAVIVLVFSAVLAWRGWQSGRIAHKQVETERNNTMGVLVMTGCCLLYAALLKPLGFIIDSILFLFVSLCLMTTKEKINYITFGIITVVAVMAIYLVFTQFFGIRLPYGIL